jgi:hypothetical protein
VCSHCGRSHDISQEGTLAGERLDAPDAVADGGVEVPDREERLRSRWGERAEWTDANGNKKVAGGADAAAVIGESRRRHKQREAVRAWMESDMSVGEFWARKVDDVPPPDDMEQLIAEVEHPDFDPSEVVGFDERVPEWHVRSVTVDGEERPASAGNGIDMVEVTNVRQRLREELDIEPSQRYRCPCGVAAYGDTMVTHLQTHGIESGAVLTSTDGGQIDMGYPDGYGPGTDSGETYESKSGSSSRSSSLGESDDKTWLCESDEHETVVWTGLGRECPRCGQSEPEDATRV